MSTGKAIVVALCETMLLFGGAYVLGYQFERGRKDASNGECLGGDRYTIAESLGRVYLGLPDDMFGKYPGR